MRRIRKSRIKNNHLADLSLTPLIDVALTLLVMFMVATPILHNAIKISLPRGSVQEDTKNQSNELVVYVDKHGEFYIETIKFKRPDLIAHIKKNSNNDNEKTVYVKADAAVSYGTVLELVDDIKHVGGIKYVALATQKNAKTTTKTMA